MPHPYLTVSFSMDQDASNCAQISLLSGAAPDATVSTVARSKLFISGRLASCTAIGGTTVNLAPDTSPHMPNVQEIEFPHHTTRYPSLGRHCDKDTLAHGVIHG